MNNLNFSPGSDNSHISSWSLLVRTQLIYYNLPCCWHSHQSVHDSTRYLFLMGQEKYYGLFSLFLNTTIKYKINSKVKCQSLSLPRYLGELFVNAQETGAGKGTTHPFQVTQLRMNTCIPNFLKVQYLRHKCFSIKIRALCISTTLPKQGAPIFYLTIEWAIESVRKHLWFFEAL